MLFLLSPAKSLDYDTPLGVHAALPATEPHFVAQAATLARLLKTKSPADVAALMHLSDTLAALNVARYRAWTRKHDAANARQAVLAFNGDVYAGLDAKTLTADDLAWAQDHLCILSGLYGVLRPFDRLQPYRLEMGTRLANPKGDDLYAFWKGRIAPYLRARLAADLTPVVVNLASQEYFRSVDVPKLGARVVDCVFEDWSAGQYKIVSFHAKKARGLMARWAVQRRALTPRALKGFDAVGYVFDSAASAPDRLVFRRKAGVSL